MRDWRDRDGTAANETSTGAVAPGKRTLVDRLQRRSASSGTTPAAAPSPAASEAAAPPLDPFDFLDGGVDNLQLAATSGERAEGDPLAIAAAGVAGPGGPLPHADQIQASFGRHDVGHVKAHVGGAAGDAASAIGAQAYATGDDVAFASAPDLFLAAHEAAHVVQQRAGVSLMGGVGEQGDPYEQHADAVAARVVRGESAEALLDAMAVGGPSTKAVQKTDLHEGVNIPDSTAQAAIDDELFPTTATVGGAPPTPWDGGAGQPNRHRNRRAFVREMHRAMAAHLRAAMRGPNGINAVARQRRHHRTPVADLEGAGRAAKTDADALFAAYATAAALTTPQEAARAAYTIHATGPNPNLLDAEDPADRRTAGMAIDPTDLAGWISETEPGCVTARTTHHFDDTRSDAERNFLRNSVVRPFVAANRAQLARYDRHGFAMSNPDTGQIVVPTTHPLGLSTTATGGVPSDAERASKWGAWRIMVHEYIHQLEHPALQAWPRRNRTISEGFCEYFTKKVLLPLLPAAAGADVARRTQVEGADHGAPSAAIIGGPYDPGSYAEYLSHAEAIEGHLGGAAIGAQNAMKAIFFQGHVEYMGYTPAGGALTAPAGPQDQITVPASLTTFATLATAVNVPEATLRSANPGAAEPLTGRLHAPGCREHRVVEASDGASSRTETATVIATQNGVTVPALTAANPGVSFAALTAGQVIIIPNH